MAHLIIFEGPRTVGKSTVVSKLRQTIEGTTSINFTGFKEGDQYGLEKVRKYYQGAFKFFDGVPNDVKIICDRIFISELIYSHLYKNYSFRQDFETFLEQLEGHTVDIIFLTVDPDHIEERLNREKAELFGKLKDTPESIAVQLGAYQQVYEVLDEGFGKKSSTTVRIHRVDTTYLTPDAVKDAALYLINSREGTIRLER